MEQTVINGATPYLAEEIIINILKRLPVKSLIRFQCVCKHWKNLFKTPFFIAAHLCHSHQNPSFIFSHDDLLSNLPLRLLDCEMQLREVQRAPLFDSLASSLCYNIVGSSNGLLCLVIRHLCSIFISFLVWNPVTGDGREVPISRIFDENDDQYVFGFGFSPLDNDYKIVAIYSDFRGLVSGVDVYSLSRGSWKEIELRSLEKVSCSWSKFSSTNINGAMFTYGLKLGKEMEQVKVKVIVSFDMGKEVFTLISWPPLWGNLYSHLALYEDKPAVITTSAIGASSNVDLWVMEENMSSSGERQNWIKKFTSDPHGHLFLGLYGGMKLSCLELKLEVK
ncbi:hypothetical protein K1719_005385 [Acacia pycnantha]|nr:hypothetical protein K1719_005385 [Acacia pycnantha]